LSAEQAPTVLVTGPDKRFKWGWWATRFSLALVGLNARYLSPNYRRVPHNVRGIIIGGGDDIEPGIYGSTENSGSRYDPARDALEMTVLRKALPRQIPILGICRGSQLINVVLGGNLHQDLRPKRVRTPNRNCILPIKWANVVENSLLFDILKCHRLKVNSLHNQAVDRLASGCEVVANDEDGFIQAIAGVGTRFLLGVQWHPEYMPYAPAQRKIFRAFAQAVRVNPESVHGDELIS